VHAQHKSAKRAVHTATRRDSAGCSREIRRHDIRRNNSTTRSDRRDDIVHTRYDTRDANLATYDDNDDRSIDDDDR